MVKAVIFDFDGVIMKKFIEVGEAVERLEEADPQAAELVKLHCFAGFTVVEAAEMLGISKSKAYLHWDYAKALMGKILG